MDLADSGADTELPALEQELSLAGTAGINGPPKKETRRRYQVQPTGESQARCLRQRPTLTAFAQPIAAEAAGVEAVDDISTVLEWARRAQQPKSILAPGGRDDPGFRFASSHTQKSVGLVEFIGQTHRYQEQTPAQSYMFVRDVVQVGEFEGHLAVLVRGCMLEFDFRVKQELVVEAIPRVENAAQEIQPGRFPQRDAALVATGEILIGHLAVSGDGDPLLFAVDRSRG